MQNRLQLQSSQIVDTLRLNFLNFFLLLCLQLRTHALFKITIALNLTDSIMRILLYSRFPFLVLGQEVMLIFLSSHYDSTSNGMTLDYQLHARCRVLHVVTLRKSKKFLLELFRHVDSTQCRILSLSHSAIVLDQFILIEMGTNIWLFIIINDGFKSSMRCLLFWSWRYT